MPGKPPERGYTGSQHYRDHKLRAFWDKVGENLRGGWSSSPTLARGDVSDYHVVPVDPRALSSKEEVERLAGRLREAEGSLAETRILLRGETYSLQGKVTVLNRELELLKRWVWVLRVGVATSLTTIAVLIAALAIVTLGYLPW